MIYPVPPLILASQSPRRQFLLNAAGFPFTVQSADVPEVLPPGMPAADAPAYLSRIKAEPVARQFPDSLVIGADTVVVLAGELIGKPKDLAEAERILNRLSGATHTVISGVTFLYGERTHTFTETTEVRFRKLAAVEIAHYLNIQPPLDKAGAYGIQDFIGLIGVEYIQGDYYNIMGLPVCRLVQELQAFLPKPPVATNF